MNAGLRAIGRSREVAGKKMPQRKNYPAARMLIVFALAATALLGFVS